jgi:hypothetical protein
MLVGRYVHHGYLERCFTDMRKYINGLSLIVSEQLGQEPFEGRGGGLDLVNIVLSKTTKK